MKKINSVELSDITVRFQHLKNKNILVYGTGINAKLLIEALQGFHIVGILDKIRYEGYIQDIPIITWDEVTKDTAEVIIIASNVKNFREIFLRIRHYGEIFNMDIYNFSGQNLSDIYYYADYTYEEMQCLNASKQELFNQIDAYDAISFDLFDTLVMRTVLEPTDIFDIVERKIKKHGMNIHHFKKKRRTAELNAKGADIFGIYKELQKIINVSDDELSLIMKEELSCEKACIIPRYDMVEALNYAIEKGKMVSIISNMYLVHDMMQDILDNIGIKQYNHLLISCEYGKGKSEGLFEVYREQIGSNTKCLHIGDDYFEDILAAQKNGMAAFYINSSLELLKMSKIRKLLLNAHGFENRLMIGLIVSKLFNNPFVLYNTNGYVPVSSVQVFAGVFIAPIVYSYMMKLLEYVCNNSYDGIIFPARDGYIFFNLYEKYRKNNSKLPESYYLTISRKIALAISQYNKNDVAVTTEKYIKTEWDINFWKQIMYFYSDNMDGILKESEKKRQLYSDYIKSIKIDFKKNYLFCELNSCGTTHYAINKLFHNPLFGFYLSGTPTMPELRQFVTYLYPTGWIYNIISRTDMLEAVLSSPKPSVGGINDNGNIFYEQEERTQNEINMMIDMHKYIEEFIEEYENICEGLKLIDLSLSNNLLALVDGIKLSGDMESFGKRNSIETMTLKNKSIMRKI